MTRTAKSKKPAKRRKYLILGCLLFFALIAVPFIVHRKIDFYTDGEDLRTEVQKEKKVIRKILWETPKLLEDSINDPELDEYEPRVSPDGDLLVFTRGRPAENADLFIAERRAGKWRDVRPLKTINTEADELGAAFSGDGQWLFFYSNREGGLGGYDIWVSQKETTEDGQFTWKEPQVLGPSVNSAHNEFSPSPAPHKNILYFTSDRRAGQDLSRRPWQATIRSRLHATDYDIFHSTWSQDEATPPAESEETKAQPLKFEMAQALFPLNQPGWAEGATSVSPGRDYLYFASNRPNGNGNFDLYRVRVLDEEMGAIENLGPRVNTSESELDPALSNDGFRIYFSRQSNGQEDIYTATSREVFLTTDDFGPYLSLGDFWNYIKDLIAKIPPGLLILLLYLLLCLLLLWFLRKRFGTLNLLTKCLLVALFIHLLMGLWANRHKVQRVLLAVIEREEEPVEEFEVSLDGIPEEEIGLAIQQAEAEEIELAELPELATSPRLTSPNPGPSPRPLKEFELSTDPVATEDIEIAQANIPSPPSSTSVQEFQNPNDEIVPNDPTTAPRSPTEEVNPRELTSQQPLKAQEESVPPSSQASVRPTRTTRATNKNSRARPTPQALEETTSIELTTTQPSTPSTPSNPKVGQELNPQEPAPFQQETLNDQSNIQVGKNSLRDTEPQTAISTVPMKGSESPNENANKNKIGKLKIARTRKASRNRSVSSPKTTGSSSISIEQQNRIPTNPSSVSTSVPSNPTTLEEVDEEKIEVAQASADVSKGTSPSPQPLTELSPQNSSRPRNVGSSSNPPTKPRVTLNTRRRRRTKSPRINNSTRTKGLGSITIQKETSQPDLTSKSDNDKNHNLENKVGALTSVKDKAIDLAKNVGSEAKKDIQVFLPKIYQLRSKERRAEALRKGGGTEQTEKAVEAGLVWLARHQSPDGRWTLNNYTRHLSEVSKRDLQHRDWTGRGPFDSRGGRDKARNGDTAATGLALLAFLGHGESHLSAGKYQKNVEKGLAWLVQAQDSNGDLTNGGNLYMHAIASFAICEAYAFTRDPDLKDAAQKAIDFTVASQNPQSGGWRYNPYPRSRDADTSVFGWMLMALKSAKLGGLEVPQKSWKLSQYYLSTATFNNRPGEFRYQPGSNRTSRAMTAQGLFCQQVINDSLGHPDEVKEVIKDYTDHSILFILNNPPQPLYDDGSNFYYWYYAGLALFQNGGEPWDKWNGWISKFLLEKQILDEDSTAYGSWDPHGKRASVAGRLYSTAMSILCLEVYYRYAQLEK